MASSSDFIRAVSNALLISLFANRHNNADISVMVYGLQESKNDYSNMYKLLDDKVQSVIQFQHLGKPIQHGMVGCSTGGSGPCPLKVDLRYIDDCA